MMHVTYGKESSSCLLNSMCWFPADPFRFLPPLSDVNSDLPGWQPAPVWESAWLNEGPWWRNRNNKSIWTPELYHFPGLSCGTAHFRLCNSSIPTNPRNLSDGGMLNSTMQVMAGAESPHDWPRSPWLGQGSSPRLQQGIRTGSWHRNDTALGQGLTVPRALPEARQQFTWSRASRS